MAENTNGDFIKITNREIWEEIRQLDDTVKSMDQRMNSILEENVELRTRLRSVELKVYTVLAGMTTALMAGGVALVNGVFGG